MYLTKQSITEKDTQMAFKNAAREQYLRLSYELQWARETAEMISERLKEEERKSKEVLDKKITAEQNKEEVDEDYKAKHTKQQEYRQEIINKQIQLSRLQKQNKRSEQEFTVLTDQNTTLLKQNDDYDRGNKKLDGQILGLIKRIDVSTLLKEIDTEEMRLLAKNNMEMQMAFQGMLSKWDHIKRKEDLMP